ncbi:MAG TPA: glycerate kinase [Candidatus Cybelea sp.]|nr:glycerate kinase [Candidatus Cybelea sp.]
MWLDQSPRDKSRMALKVLIAPDKFKGTLTARAAAEAMAKGWRKARRADAIELLPMSDGGDGFGAVMGELADAKIQTVRTVDAAHRPCPARWWWEAKTKTAIIESAGVIGLAQLPPGKFHPFKLDTFGLGKVIRAAAAKGARRCLIGIGGSATNDGGFGMACALGWEFLDGDGHGIGSWTELYRLAELRAPKRRRLFEEMIVAVDVQNRLLGKYGCTRIYGPQKGLRPEDFPVAERNLRRLAAVVKKDLKHDYASEPGAGAAGGLGFGLRAFAGAKLRPGFELFARQAQLERRIRTADLVITGEGAIDDSTLMGKGVGQLARMCAKLKRPCLGLAGIVSAQKRAEGFFDETRGLTDLTAVENAKKRPAFWLERLAAQAAREWGEKINGNKSQ